MASIQFQTDEVSSPGESRFDRQERISWWDQDRLSQARVMVVGAGAIGNEVLKNLALLGIGHLFVVDFDTIETSNLSRTVLFRPEDQGKRKVDVAVERTRSLGLADDFTVHGLHGDVVWDVGTGIFRRMDIVLGCLDNVEARMNVNRKSWLAETPWIDAGINKLGMHVTTYVPPSPPCYECNLSESKREDAGIRYSCQHFKREFYEEGKVPTTQVASSLVAALQTQEAIKLLCDQKPEVGSRIYFQGLKNDFQIFDRRPNPDCSVHDLEYPSINTLNFTRSDSLRSFLERVSKPDASGKGATLDLRGDYIFVASVQCQECGSKISFDKPGFRIYDTDIVCGECGHGSVDSSGEISSQMETISEFRLGKISSKYLEFSLEELGFPHRHVASVRDKNGNYDYYEIGGDFTNLLL